MIRRGNNQRGSGNIPDEKLKYSKAPQQYNKILKLVESKVGNDTTYTKQLLKAGEQFLGTKLKGVYPSDKIPKLTKSQPYAIINLDNSSEKGSHWVSVAKINKGILYYDSFGRKVSQHLPSLSKSGNGKVIENKDYTSEQRKSQNNCGARSLSHLIFIEEYGPQEALKI